MTTKGIILKAIRETCLDCCCGSINEVKTCAVGTKCSLYPYRMGHDPLPSRKGFAQKSHRVHDEIFLNQEVLV